MIHHSTSTHKPQLAGNIFHGLSEVVVSCIREVHSLTLGNVGQMAPRTPPMGGNTVVPHVVRHGSGRHRINSGYRKALKNQCVIGNRAQWRPKNLSMLSGDQETSGRYGASRN